MAVLKFTTGYAPFIPTAHNFRNLTGQVFGQLTVFGLFGKSNKSVYWLVRCTCGTWRNVQGRKLLGEQTKSCGCLHGSDHGMRNTPEYCAYHHAKNRCINPKLHNYHRYGGRGIKFLFRNFAEFFTEIGPRPSVQHTVDRINNDGHYEPGNIQWTTRPTQMRNMHRNHWITINGETHIITDWARLFNKDARQIYARIRRYGWCEPCAVQLPIGHRCQHPRS